MTTAPDGTQAIAVAADVIDAMDPNLSHEERRAAAIRAARKHPVLAVSLATQYTHGLLTRLTECDPDRAAETMRNLRAAVASMELP